MITLLYILLAAVTLVMILVILAQDSKAGGLSAAISGTGETRLATAGQQGITRFTGWLAFAFFILCIVITYCDAYHNKMSDIPDEAPKDLEQFVPEGSGESSSLPTETPKTSGSTPVKVKVGDTAGATGTTPPKTPTPQAPKTEAPKTEAPKTEAPKTTPDGS